MDVGPKACSLSAQIFSRRKPSVSVVLRFDFTNERVGDGADLRAGVEMLGEAGNAGVGVRRKGGIVLVEVLQRQRVFAGGVVVEVGDGQVSRESSRAGDECVVEMGRRWAEFRPRASLGMSHLPGSPGSAGELNRTSASGSMFAPVIFGLPNVCAE